MNAEACRILGTSAEAACGEPVETALGPVLARMARRVLASRRAVLEDEIRIERRHAPPIPAEVAVAPFFDAAAEPDGAVLEVRDRSLRRALLDADGERRRMTSFGRIAAGIAHEVKNPLGGIRGAGEILAKRAEDPRTRDAAELIVREADRISALLDDFMVLGQDETLRPRAVNLHRILDDVLDLHGMDPLSEGVAVERVYDPSIPELMADRDRLAQVFHNLVRNALQAMAEAGRGGHLTITTRVALDEPLSTPDAGRVAAVAVAVRDTGPGIPEAARDKLTVPFFTTRRAGTGLGLAIAQHWVACHGGRLAIDGSGEGTVARVLLPLRRTAP